MRKRIVLACLAGAAITIAAPLAASANAQTAPASPACVVVNGPNGLHLQIGYAPTGPDGCIQL